MPERPRRRAERQPRETLTFDMVKKAAVRRALTAGVHLTTVIAEGSLDMVPAVLGDFGGTHDEKLKQLFLAGTTVARRGGVGILQKAFLIAEVWATVGQAEHLPELTPEQDPARKEALLVNGLALEDRTQQAQLLEMMRDKDGKLIGLREFGPLPEVTANAENPLLNAFVAGYQFVMKARVN